jgi:hypothetical protein
MFSGLQQYRQICDRLGVDFTEQPSYLLGPCKGGQVGPHDHHLLRAIEPREVHAETCGLDFMCRAIDVANLIRSAVHLDSDVALPNLTST